MAALLNEQARILVTGIGNRLCQFQCREMMRYGNSLAGIVSTTIEGDIGIPAGIRVFTSVREATRSTGASTLMIFEEPFDVKPVALEAIRAGIKTVICLTESVPTWDVIDVRDVAREFGARLIGPASSGLLSPGKIKAGYFVEDICLQGPVGVITKSGSLSYAVLAELKSHGLGISTVVSTGGERVKGSNFVDLLPFFFADAETRAIVLLGEIGGTEEEVAAHFLSTQMNKPVIAFISGRSLPLGQSLGHAGAIAQLGKGDYESKARALRQAGVQIAENIGHIAILVRAVLASTS